jgi:uncharacterized membrane protein YidH (DUF202 family)
MAALMGAGVGWWLALSVVLLLSGVWRYRRVESAKPGGRVFTCVYCVVFVLVGCVCVLLCIIFFK